jgi:hypothetical protein
VLTGRSPGGWLNLEDSITGHAAVRSSRGHLLRAMGAEPYEALIETLYEAFVARRTRPSWPVGA